MPGPHRRPRPRGLPSGDHRTPAGLRCPALQAAHGCGPHQKQRPHGMVCREGRRDRHRPHHTRHLRPLRARRPQDRPPGAHRPQRHETVAASPPTPHRPSRQPRRFSAKSQFSILNSQFSIPNSQFSILNSQFSEIRLPLRWRRPPNPPPTLHPRRRRPRAHRARRRLQSRRAEPLPHTRLPARHPWQQPPAHRDRRPLRPHSPQLHEWLARSNHSSNQTIRQSCNQQQHP